MDHDYIRTLVNCDKNCSKRLDSISESLAQIELSYLTQISRIADLSDIDRRVVLFVSLSTMDEVWSDVIMCLKSGMEIE